MPNRIAGNGERGNWQGHVFSNCVRDFVIKSGYKEIFSCKYGIDFLGDPSQSDSSVLPPKSAPNGVTAFEFTSQSNISEEYIKKFAVKIEGIKGKYSDVSGGIIVCDVRVSDELYSIASRYSVYVWDLRDCSFYTEKYRLFETLKKKGQTKETLIPDNVSYIWTLDRSQRGGFFKGYLCILNHQQVGALVIGDIDRQFTEIHHQIADNLKSIGCIPIEVEVIWLLRPFVSKDVHLGIDDILRRFSEEESITYTRHGLYNFYIAPWYFGLYSQL